MINHKIEDRLSGNPPTFLTIVKKDPAITNLKNEVAIVLEKNFDAVRQYCERFDEIHAFYRDDMIFDEKIIRENDRCDIFRKWCLRYRSEEEEILRVVDFQPMGIFYLQLERFKNGVLPAPRDKQRVLEVVMPG